MKITLSFFELLIIIGMVTGIVCSILLFTKSEKRTTNTFLGLGILGFVWLNTKTLLLSLNLWDVHGLGFFPNGVELALPPLFYLYIFTLVKPQLEKKRNRWHHFIPFFCSQTYATVVYIAIMQTRIPYEKEQIAQSFFFNEVKYAEDVLSAFSAIIYLYFGYRLLQQYWQWLQRNTSDTRYSELGFLKNLFIGLLIISLYTIINLILNQFLDDREQYPWRWQVSHLIIATVVYYMGLVGYKHSDIIPSDFSNNPPKPIKKPNEQFDLEMISKLHEAIETDKVHLNPKLSLRDLAHQLAVNEAVLSNTINTHYKKNFRAFINEARVEEVKRRLLEEGLSKLSLLGLAKECGFNSEASFYRIFRAIAGSTPKQFLAANSFDSQM